MCLLSAILCDVPAVRHAIAYGSGVFKQPGLYTTNASHAMLDFLLIVDDASNWHEQVRGFITRALLSDTASALQRTIWRSCGGMHEIKARLSLTICTAHCKRANNRTRSQNLSQLHF
jgi:hypothetical protein